MKANKLFVLIGSLLTSMAASSATNINYDLFGSLVSVSYPSSSSEQILNPSAPSISGTAQFISDTFQGSPYLYFSATVDPEYHAMLVGNGALANVTYAGLEQSVNSSSLAGNINYDPVTRHLTGTGASISAWGVGSYCTGIISTCGDLYKENNKNWNAGSTASFDIVFTDTFDNFSGELIVNSKLDTNSWISRTYEITSIPLPGAEIFFGSALLFLARAKRAMKFLK